MLRTVLVRVEEANLRPPERLGESKQKEYTLEAISSSRSPKSLTGGANEQVAEVVLREGKRVVGTNSLIVFLS